MKAISAVIATVMLLMTTVSLVGVFYVFSSTMAGTTTSSGGQQASQLTAQLSMCLQIDNIIGNHVTLRNCGKGVIENKSLVVMMDDVALGASTNTIQEGNSSIVNVSGLWQIPFGKRNLKISNGAAVALAIVDVQPKKDGLVGSWNFDEGTGNNANDDSGNGNVGTLNNFDWNATSGWTAGKFGNGLQFDGTNDYVDAGNASSLNAAFGSEIFTLEAWVYPKDWVNYRGIINKRTSNYYSASPGGLFSYANGIAFIIGTGNDAETSTNINYEPTLNNWHHVAGTAQRINSTHTNMILYVDGVIRGNTLTTLDPQTNNNATIIGAFYANSRSFNGTIDEVRIWNKSFAPDETAVMKQII